MRIRHSVLAGIDAVLLSTICVCVCAGAVVSPALAAAPEAPTTEAPSAIAATSATLKGELNPGAASENVSYHFAYSPGAECGESGLTAPHEPPFPQAEGNHKKISLTVSGLVGSTEYSACLVAANPIEEAESTVGSTVKFTTPASLPVILSQSSPTVMASTATLQAEVNPENQMSTQCTFEYGALLVSENKTPCEQPPLEGSTPVAVSAAVVGLSPGTTYHYRVVMGNATGIAEGTEQEFTTTIPPATPEQQPATEVTATGATLHGVLNPSEGASEPGTYEFLYRESETECGGGGATPVTATSGTREEVSAPITGLTPTRTYTFCLRATNSVGEMSPPNSTATFTTPAAAPVVSNESFSDAGSASVRLSGSVNPGGSPTSYRFEYGPSAAYGLATPSASAGSGLGEVGVIRQVGGLQPDTVYHYRLVGINKQGETSGADATFRTASIALLGLPDGRGYEIVSPVANGNSSVYEPQLQGQGWSNTLQYGAITSLPFQAAGDGSALAYIGDPPPTDGNGAVGQSEGNQYLARRPTGHSWTSVDIQPPLLAGPIYQAFSSNLSIGFLGSGQVLSSGAPAGGYDVLYSTVLDSGAYRPLFSMKPLHRTASEFEAFHVPFLGLGGSLAYAGASSDMTHLLFEANDALTEPESVDGGRDANNLYDSVDGVPLSVNILPNGKPDANATFGGPNATGRNEDEPDFERVISSDGSRIFWTDLNTSDIYMRENEGTSLATTVPVGNGQYWTANADGSLVFYTNNEALYRYDVGSGVTTDLSPDANPGEEPDVQGVVGASEDGSYVYFVAKGNLAAGATPGEPNLYVTHRGTIELVAVLSPADNLQQTRTGVKSFGDWAPGLGEREAQVTPDGRHLAFASVRSLTGYENAGQQIFVYDASSGRLSCASCNPTGEPPHTGQTAAVPVSFSNTYMHRWISSDGSRVFFDTREALVPQDQNGQVDVYEWEQGGAGSCRLARGCIYLLSGGTSADGSFFLDASANGDDVFIVTRAQLVSVDKNEVFDAYDVRIGASEPPAAPVCTGTDCQALPGTPPIFATPSSATFDGVGNFAPPVKPPPTRAQKLAKVLKECRKNKVKRRRKTCEGKARKAYGARARRSTAGPAMLQKHGGRS